jgi:hypothetical protein
MMVIKKPSKPMSPRPIAEILDTALNSSVEGFLSRCQTLVHWARKELIFSLTVMIILFNDSF